MTYSMTCTCGDVMSVEAENRDEGVAKLKEMMNADAIAKHFADKHSGQPVASQEQAHSMIAQNTREG